MSREKIIPLYYGYYTISVLFNDATACELVAIANEHIAVPALSMGGLHEPIGIIARGYSQRGIPLNILNIFFEEYKLIQDEPITALGVNLDEADGSVFVEYELGPKFALMQTMMQAALRRHSEKVFHSDEGRAYVYLGKGVSDPKRMQKMEMHCETQPAAIALGNLADNWGFRVILNDKKCKRKLRKYA